MADTLSEDPLLGGKVRLRQPREGYRAAIDPVLLAAATPARPGERVLDLGTGSGAASLCLMARVEDLDIVGLELDPETAALARANAALNARDRFTVREGDVARLPKDLRGFDRVIANPPYLETARADPSSKESRRRSNVDEKGLAAWIGAALAAAAPRATITLIQRADRLAEMLALLHGKAGAIVVVPLWPSEGMDAKRVIVEVMKGAKTPLRLHPGLVLHAPGGRYAPTTEAILRGAAFDVTRASPA